MESLIKLSNSWSLTEAMEDGTMVTFPWVVFGRGLADPGVVAGPGSVMTTVEDLGVEEPRGEARLQKRFSSPIRCQESWWGT